MSHAAAAAKLGGAGIGISSSGGCSNKNNPSCTSLDGVLTGTIDNAVVLKGACGCALTVTGGTETGHGSGPGKTHGNGYKLDFRKNAQLDSYVKNSFAYAGVRGDGYKMWKSAAGNIYCVSTPALRAKRNGGFFFLLRANCCGSQIRTKVTTGMSFIFERGNDSHRVYTWFKASSKYTLFP